MLINRDHEEHEHHHEPGFVEKMKAGPIVFMTVRPGGEWSMGPALAQWFLYSVVVSVVAAYVAGRALGAGAEYLDVFHLERYRHRLSMEGLPLFYYALVGRKAAEIPGDFLERHEIGD